MTAQVSANGANGRSGSGSRVRSPLVPGQLLVRIASRIEIRYMGGESIRRAPQYVSYLAHTGLRNLTNALISVRVRENSLTDPSFDTPHQFSKISTFHPVLFSTATYTETASSTDTPTFAHLPNNARWSTTDHCSRGDDHVGWYDSVGQDFAVLLDHSEGMYNRVSTDMNVTRYLDRADCAVGS